MKLICKQCKQEFEITDSEIKFFKSKNLNIPKRCRRCRAVNKSKNNTLQPNISYSNDFYYDDSDRKNSFFKALIIFLIIVTCALVILLPPTYYLNTNTNKFHRPSCPSVVEMNHENRKKFYGTREEAIEKGYSPCQNCNP